MSQRIRKIKQAIFERPYVFYFIVIFLLYIIINIFINQLYVTGFDVLFELLNIFIALLVPLTINLSIIKFKELRNINSAGSGAGFLGLFGGFLGGACPGCFAGLFPVFLGLFGVTASLSILPFYGLEILAASIVLLIISVWVLTNETTCKIPRRKK